ncbi:MAG: adenylate kinase [Vicinamibacterales bacterium]|nr:adenylate kinase [Vicinamibacterales bacterium]
MATAVPLNVVLFGPPGAGKGTQADVFAECHAVPKISTGDMLRRAIQEGSELGLLVKDTLQRGALVSDDLMIRLVGQRLEWPDTAGGFVLDGFPRTIEQAAALERMMAGRGPIVVIALVVHADEVVRRLSHRGRHDDEEWVIRERLQVYSDSTEPVLEYFRRRKTVTVLDGNRPPEEVTKAIEGAVSQAIERASNS